MFGKICPSHNVDYAWVWESNYYLIQYLSFIFDIQMITNGFALDKLETPCRQASKLLWCFLFIPHNLSWHRSGNSALTTQPHQLETGNETSSRVVLVSYLRTALPIRHISQLEPKTYFTKCIRINQNIIVTYFLEWVTICKRPLGYFGQFVGDRYDSAHQTSRIQTPLLTF